MYFPYFRGKQNELIVIRDASELLAKAGIVPIIEPVKKSITSLSRSIEALMEFDAEFILIVNPKNGELKNDSTPLLHLVSEGPLISYPGLCLGYIVDANSSLTDIVDFVGEYCDYKVAIIHNGFPSGKALSDELEGFTNVYKHIFVGDTQGLLYRNKFRSSDRVLILDGFTQQVRNSDHADKEIFSELHLTYSDYGMQGFGDFLIVGDSYSETGGPAYTVAIHLTYFGDEGVMFIRHFKSAPSKTPADPGGKFAEALNALIEGLKDGEIPITNAVREFQDLHLRGHYPGLGYVKKLSMQHHIELFSDYILNQ